MTGRVLSIYDSSDQIAGPCAPYKPLTAKTSSFEEISISLGEGHGFQFSVNSAWITPALVVRPVSSAPVFGNYRFA
jgi:hypothetical protein